MGTKATSMKVVSLEVNNFEIPGHPAPSSWGWVDITHVCRLIPRVNLPNHRLGLNFRSLYPSELLERYGHLSKDDGVLAVVMDFEFDNWDLSALVEAVRRQERPDTRLNSFSFNASLYVPAGWANDVIDEATGVNLQRQQERVKERAESIFAAVKSCGFASYRYDDHDNSDDEASQILAQIHELADEAEIHLRVIHAKTHQDVGTNSCHEYKVVVYDTARYEQWRANYGPDLEANRRELEKGGYFAVAADMVSSWGSVYYLRGL